MFEPPALINYHNFKNPLMRTTTNLAIAMTNLLAKRYLIEKIFINNNLTISTFGTRLQSGM